MKLSSILKHLGLSVSSNLDIKNIEEHSAQVQEDTLFIAHRGTSKAYIESAIVNGARAILSDKANTGINELKSKLPVPLYTFENINHIQTKVLQYFYKDVSYPTLIAVTGTNGKTTVSSWIGQILKMGGARCGVIGTLGVDINGSYEYTGLTTPGQCRMYSTLAAMSKRDITHVVFEASSHALEQGRVAGLPIKVGIFTNLSQDHLDYHRDMDSYFAAKAKLFLEYNIEHAILNLDDLRLRKFSDKLRLLGVNVTGVACTSESTTCLIPTFRASSVVYKGINSTFNIETPDSNKFEGLTLNTVGKFNLQNILLAIASCTELGLDVRDVVGAINKVKPVSGRLELVIDNDFQPRVWVDFAHTPSGLEEALKALKTSDKKNISVVFGCGGERDVAKRPLMLKAALTYATKVYITQDNSRNEDPNMIIEDMVAGNSYPNVTIILDRKEAILAAIKDTDTNSDVLVAGRGHEQVHDLGSVKYNYTDADAVREAAASIL